MKPRWQSMCYLTSLSLTGPQRSRPGSSCSLLLCAPPHRKVLHIAHCTSCNQSKHQPNGCQLPTSVRNYSIHWPHLCAGPKNYSTLLSLQSLPHEIPSAAYMALPSIWCPPPRSRGIMWLIKQRPSHLSKVRCHAFSWLYYLGQTSVGWKKVGRKVMNTGGLD